MKNVSEKIEFYKKMRDYFNNKTDYQKQRSNYCDLLTLCGGSTCFSTLRHDIASGVLGILGEISDNKVYRLQKKQDKIKNKR